MKPKVSVILPTYNEKENIAALIDRVDSIVDPFEIIVVDDDSPDKTWAVVEKASRKNRKIRLLRRTGKNCLATAVADGIDASKGDVLIWLDCDFSHPPELMPDLLEALDKYDIALASRFVDGGGMKYARIRILASRLVCWFAGLVLDPSVKDYTSGYLAIKRKVLHEVKIRKLGGGYGEYFIDLLYRAKKAGYAIKEIPYVYVPRKYGETKTNPNMLKLLGHGASYAFSIIAIKLKN